MSSPCGGPGEPPSPGGHGGPPWHPMATPHTTTNGNGTHPTTPHAPLPHLLCYQGGAPGFCKKGCMLCLQGGTPGYASSDYHHTSDELRDIEESIQPLSRHEPLPSELYAAAAEDSLPDAHFGDFLDRPSDAGHRLPPVSTIIQASLAKEGYDMPSTTDRAHTTSLPPLNINSVESTALSDSHDAIQRHDLVENAMLEHSHFLGSNDSISQQHHSDLLSAENHSRLLETGVQMASDQDADRACETPSGEEASLLSPPSVRDEESARVMLSLAEQWARSAHGNLQIATENQERTSSSAGDSSLAARDGLLSEESLSPVPTRPQPPTILPVVSSLFSLPPPALLQPLPPLLLSGLLPSPIQGSSSFSSRPDSTEVRVKQEPPDPPREPTASPTTRVKTEKPFRCNLCGKHLASKNVHQLHMRSHSGEKPFACALCGHHFSQKTSLTRHMRSHTGERPFPCEVCGKRFADKERIKIHMRTHTGEKPFACDVCGKTFSQKSTVKRHMSVHTGEKPFKCEVCGKGFANRGNLNAHAKTHAHS
ncbi:protein glass-like isoform X2 [Ornithodoros turicata]|uniref:protein glass-like isoform X2 n=1 Tax=Ornithodoros turicata TaxID=34597 RepID=UPI003139C224